MSARWHRWAFPIALATALVGCNFNLDDATLVKTPRILAISAERPELNLGVENHIRVMAYDPLHRDLTYVFRACFDFSSVFGGGSNGSGGVAATMPTCVDLAANGNTGTLAPDSVMTLFTEAASAGGGGMGGGGGVDPSTLAFIQTIVATAGVPITIQVDVRAADTATGEQVVIVTGTKQIGITTRARPTTNPPFVFFRIGDSEYLGGFDADDPFTCIPWQTAPASFEASPPAGMPANEVTLSPLDDPDTWIESFPIYDFSGDVRTGWEGAYYSWYATGGSMHTETTQWRSHGAEPSEIDATIRDNTWDVPRDPGTYDMWVVVRDGHLGVTGCHLTVEVTPRP